MRCTASGQRRTWDPEAWVRGHGEPVVCPDCGAIGTWVWVRGTDLCPHAKTRAHQAPPGVTPSPYAAPGGGKLVAP